MNILASKEQLRASFLRWALFLVPLIVLLGFISGQLGSPSTQWFQSLTKPSIFPPTAIFGVVWTVLWVLIGFSVALVGSAWGARGRGIALIAFVFHFVGTLAWTPVFFGMQDMESGLYLLAYAAVTLVIVIALFWKVRRTAALLLVPYFGWVCFAAALNYQFIAENPEGGSDDENGAAVEINL
ncbi:TspO/MBR family protein [Erythrobacter rubeus]|uniref:Tryptophan-rich sensory protein n=1 Tax=Erythrobacter rubeus TaxID=2760803 RepID=A0ABR8KNK7_9SPHN|nr:TspO/MBR family protein [Erythrobacter rubeus]MBD2841394.1 tryptophan-rich sensory protein [Erythrobacter rubeus]